MGCCQSGPPPAAEQKSAFSDFTGKKDHHTGDSNYTLSSMNKIHNTAKYYETRLQNSPSNENQNYTMDTAQTVNKTSELAHLNSSKSKSSHSSSANSTQGLIKPKHKTTHDTLPSDTGSPNDIHTRANPLPFDKHEYKANLSPANTPNPVNPKYKDSINSNSTIASTNTRTISPIVRRNSISKSKSRSFRPRKEPKSPENNMLKNIRKSPQTYSNEPPPINDRDSDSSDSDDVEIPGLKEIVLSDNEDSSEDSSDENLKLIAIMVEQENLRLAAEIQRVKSHVQEQEDQRLKQEAYEEIEQEQQRLKLEHIESGDTSDQIIDSEEEKKRKALARYEKKQKQRMREKEEAKERRRLKKEEQKKKHKAKLLKQKMVRRQQERLKKREETREKRKKELEAYTVEESRPTRDEILQMFEKYFYKPFETNQSMHKRAPKKSMTDSSDSDSSDSDSEEALGNGGINFEGFTAGIQCLGIDLILNKSEIEQLFDHMIVSSREYGINAVDFVYFLKQNTITLEPKLATIQRKLVSSLAKQQDKEDKINQEKVNNGDTNETKTENDINRIGNAPQMIIQISQPLSKVADIIYPETPKETIDDNEEDSSDEDESMDTIKERKLSVSMSESMSMSISTAAMNIPSNVPRKSFKQISMNWNDSISKKSFQNYKKLREKFGNRYYSARHEKNKTRDQELAAVHEKVMSGKLILDDSPAQTPEISENKDTDNSDTNKENEIPKHAVITTILNTETETKTDNKLSTSVQMLSGIDETKENDTYGIPDSGTALKDNRSAVQSLRRVNAYTGNEDINNLRKLYKEQFKMKQKLQRLRKRSLLNFPAPPKPTDAQGLMDDKTSYICKELKQCVCKNTRYTGLANFGPNGELGIEIEFTSDMDENGYIMGRRIVQFKGMKQAHGKGRVWVDLAWNGHKYVPCTRFEWIDEGEGVTTKFWFDSVKNNIDVDHSFFEGNAIRYPSDLDPKKKTTKLIMHEGFFDFVCVSARRRTLRKNSNAMNMYHTLDINDMNENELEKVPKYVRRMSAYTEKIDKLYDTDVPVTKDQLFGSAISTVAAIHEVDPIMSDNSMPEQINE